MVKKTGPVKPARTKPAERSAKKAGPSAASIADDGDAERRILDAAHAVFVRSGTAGARMQEIADEAGVNKALLHYYFRSKERLADAVFQRVAASLFPRVVEVVRSDLSLEEKIRGIIGVYLDQLLETPYAPAYLIGEINHHPERATQLAAALGTLRGGAPPSTLLDALERQISARARAGEIRAIPARELLTNLVSLCIFPFAARPMLCAVMGMDDAGFRAFIAQRKRELPEFVLAGLRP